MWWLRTLFAVITLVVTANAYSKDEIFVAVRNDDPEGIQKALDDGADIDQIGTGGQTPLINAVLSGKINVVPKLLEAGADTSLTEKDGYNVLHAAGFQGRGEILKIILDHGLDPMDKHKDGFYPIHRACWGRDPRHTQTVKVFLENGISPDLKAENGKTCMDMTKNEGTQALLVERANAATADEL
jgi:ankyrin repeat protein